MNLVPFRSGTLFTPIRTTHIFQMHSSQFQWLDAFIAYINLQP